MLSKVKNAVVNPKNPCTITSNWKEIFKLYQNPYANKGYPVDNPFMEYKYKSTESERSWKSLKIWCLNWRKLWGLNCENGVMNLRFGLIMKCEWSGLYIIEKESLDSLQLCI
jgi:hypothetical protein